jgi:hypothetical protein
LSAAKTHAQRTPTVGSERTYVQDLFGQVQPLTDGQAPEQTARNPSDSVNFLFIRVLSKPIPSSTKAGTATATDIANIELPAMTHFDPD